MKKLFLIISLFASFTAAKAQTADVNSLWDKANSLYSAGDFAGAAAAYDSIAGAGYASAKLFYNMGNAYFKDNQTGRAILNYYRAQRLAPSDEDVAYNLAIAESFVKDRIETVPEFFVKTWLRAAMNSMNSNTWAAISLLCAAIALGLCAVYLLSARLGARKAGFYGGIAFLIIFVIALTFASIQRQAVKNPVEAIVMQSAAPVKSSPDDNSKDIFVLHEGTKVRITAAFGDWKEIVIADGNKGWIRFSAIEII